MQGKVRSYSAHVYSCSIFMKGGEEKLGGEWIRLTISVRIVLLSFAFSCSFSAPSSRLCCLSKSSITSASGISSSASCSLSPLATPRSSYFCYVAFPRTVRFTLRPPPSVALLCFHTLYLASASSLLPCIPPGSRPLPSSSRNIFPPNVRVHLLRVQHRSIERARVSCPDSRNPDLRLRTRPRAAKSRSAAEIAMIPVPPGQGGGRGMKGNYGECRTSRKTSLGARDRSGFSALKDPPLFNGGSKCTLAIV
jgi:hypothetical protein